MFIEQFLDWAHAGLLASEEAQEYLLGRGISADQWAIHRIGYVAGDFDVDPTLCSDHSASCSNRDKKHLWCDVCRYRQWSSVWVDKDGFKEQIVGRRIRGSIVFPLTSYSGVHVGFQTRSISQKEYDTFALQRRPEGFFFGCQMNFREVWASREVVLVEGPGDHLLIERLVAPNVLGLTTSGLSKAQLQFVRRFARRVILCLDLDEAGRKGVKSFVDRNKSFFDIVNLKYPRVRPGDKDPGDYWKRVGDETFSRYFNKALGRI